MYNIFYEEPFDDRWFKYDRYPRKVIRRILRGPEPIGGVQRWFINLCLGLDELGVPYTVNNYKKLRLDAGSWALVVGKPHVIKKIPSHIPIIYGPGIAAHPFESDFWKDNSNIRHLLISCEWFRDMYARDLPVSIPASIWPSGIETERWKPAAKKPFKNTILIYDKVRWRRDEYQTTLIEPIKKHLYAQGIQVQYIRYGHYQEEDFRKLLQETDGMIFLCEHETQGFAYLQTLASGVPILAWDRGGYWQDPSLFPERVKFSPVTSVPYWDESCGERFENIDTFQSVFGKYWTKLSEQQYHPRKYITDHFRLADCAARYIRLVNDIIQHESTVSI